ncbi:MAG: hypothetical protein CVV25_09540 [Ignavibacteriae bacterium HGW-Ignavibacteriae-4]|nr:MAG: hypothetical protein CVV25_09540 [Ignavibacteriae bacterium HGW-Ignavibacteriae-4]
MIRIIPIVVLLIFALEIEAKDFETLLENYFGNRTPAAQDYLDLSQIQDIYDYYSTDPININSASKKQLRELPFITDWVIDELKSKGPYKNRFELEETINNIVTDEIIKFVLRECLTTSNTKEKDFNNSYTVRYRSNLEPTKGFVNDKYMGSELNLYQKLRTKYQDFELSTVVDKDDGELSITDFYSLSLKYEKEDYKLIVGDYNLSYGLGNLYDQSFLSLKNSDFVNTSSEFGHGAEMNRSTIDYNFFRGGYLEKTFHLNSSSNLRVASLYADTKRSATVDTARDIVSSVYKAGYFRTETEIKKKNQLDELLLGLNVEYETEKFSIGALSTHLGYNKFIESSSFSSFYGQSGFLNTIYGRIGRNDEILKFEICTDVNSNISLRTNYLLEIYENLIFLTDIRYTEPNYRAPYAMNFGEQSFMANEKGILTGISYNYDNMRIALFSDFYNSELKTFTTTKPIRGIEYYLDLVLDNKSTKYNIRIDYERKSDTFKSDTMNTKFTIPNTKLNTRFEVNSNLGKYFVFRGRAELSFKINDFQEVQGGNLILLELKKKGSKLDLQYGLSFITFNTTDFETVIYTYLYQVPGFAYVYPFYQSGNNINAFVKYKLIDEISLWFRINHLFKNSNGKIGSGNEEIVGNERTQLIFQMQYLID